MTARERFRTVSNWITDATGSPLAFLLALSSILVWAATGPLLRYSETWMLIVNTGTTIITFLMVFLVQSSQNRDRRALRLKLDELIRSQEGARNELIDLEKQTEEVVKEVETEMKDACK